MNEKNASGQPFPKLFFLILAVFILFFGLRVGIRQLKIWKKTQTGQITEPVFRKEVIVPVVEKPKKIIEEGQKDAFVPETKPEEKSIQDSQQKLFTVQVASFQDKFKAEIVVAELKKKGYVPAISRKDLSEKGIWYRVFVGDFDNEDEARELLKVLREDYKNSFIKLRSND